MKDKLSRISKGFSEAIVATVYHEAGSPAQVQAFAHAFDIARAEGWDWEHDEDWDHDASKASDIEMLTEGWTCAIASVFGNKHCPDCGEDREDSSHVCLNTRWYVGATGGTE